MYQISRLLLSGGGRKKQRPLLDSRVRGQEYAGKNPTSEANYQYLWLPRAELIIFLGWINHFDTEGGEWVAKRKRTRSGTLLSQGQEWAGRVSVKGGNAPRNPMWVLGRVELSLRYHETHQAAKLHIAQNL